MRKYLAALSFFILVLFSAGLAYCDEMTISQEDLDYRKFKLDNETCDVAILYRDKKDGADVAVSAIAMGKGAMEMVYRPRGREVSDIHQVSYVRYKGLKRQESDKPQRDEVSQDKRFPW